MFNADSVLVRAWLFTFQYGSTQIRFGEELFGEFINLHSNMDLLKYHPSSGG